MNSNANHTEEYDLLPIGIIFNPYFKAFNHCLMEFMCDYEYNRRWGNDRHHQFVLIELKDYIKTRFAKTTGQVEIKYTGRCFTYRYLRKGHSKVINLEKKSTQPLQRYQKYLADPDLQNHYQLYRKAIDKRNVEITENQKWNKHKCDLVKTIPENPTPEEYTIIFGSYHYNQDLYVFLNQQSKTKTGTYIYKKRYIEKHMTYGVCPYAAASVWNLKQWNAERKTNNTGLSRIYFWTKGNLEDKATKDDQYCYGGWMADSLERYCITNGWKKTTTPASKMRYGDWGMWAYKVCDPLPSPYVYNWDLNPKEKLIDDRNL